MRVVIFFICLCFLLLKGDAPAYAGAPHHSIPCSPARHFTKKPDLPPADKDQDAKVIRQSCPEDENEDIICDDVEDEDEDVNIFLAGKYRLPLRCNATVLYQSILNYLCNSFKAPQPFCGLVSYKYIIQRTLRI